MNVVFFAYLEDNFFEKVGELGKWLKYDKKIADNDGILLYLKGVDLMMKKRRCLAIKEVGLSPLDLEYSNIFKRLFGFD